MREVILTLTAIEEADGWRVSVDIGNDRAIITPADHGEIMGHFENSVVMLAKAIGQGYAGSPTTGEGAAYASALDNVRRSAGRPWPHEPK